MRPHSGMKCFACGHDGRTWEDAAGQLHATGSPFVPVVIEVKSAAPDGSSVIDKYPTENLQACPSCGTVRMWKDYRG